MISFFKFIIIVSIIPGVIYSILVYWTLPKNSTIDSFLQKIWVAYIPFCNMVVVLFCIYEAIKNLRIK